MAAEVSLSVCVGCRGELPAPTLSGTWTWFCRSRPKVRASSVERVVEHTEEPVRFWVIWEALHNLHCRKISVSAFAFVFVTRGPQESRFGRPGPEQRLEEASQAPGSMNRAFAAVLRRAAVGGVSHHTPPTTVDPAPEGPALR